MIRTRLLTLLCFSAMALAAQPAATPAGVPAGATKAGDGYHYTDPQGRQWIYRITPFGVARIPAAEAASTKAAKSAHADENLRATDHGDTVSFERPGPFGVYRWERKKSEMDAGERAAWQRQMSATVETDRK
jgi:hypothetical protein